VRAGVAVAAAPPVSYTHLDVYKRQVVSFAVQSHALPTLSYYVGHVTRYRIGRGLFFALWLGCGSYLVGAWRRERAK